MRRIIGRSSLARTIEFVSDPRGRGHRAASAVSTGSCNAARRTTKRRDERPKPRAMLLIFAEHAPAMTLPDPDRERRAAALLHHRGATLLPGESTTTPLVASTTFHLPPADEVSSFYYGRAGMPVWEAVESELAILEAAPSLLFPSGMAAITATLMATLEVGSTVLVPSDGYFATRRLAERVLSRFGITVRECPTSSLADADFRGVALVFVETPSNPALDVCDIALVAERAHAAGALVVADNTTSTAYLQRPLDLGADVVVAADTKAPAGHSDALAGHVSSRDTAVMERVREWRTLGGAIPGPFETWLLQRGLVTLELRLERMCRSAQALADALISQTMVSGLRYPGLPDDPSHAIAARQMTGFGTIVSFELDGTDRAARFIERCPQLASATSFGGVHSSAERRARWGDAVAPGFIRLSVGCEPTAGLIAAVLETLKALD